MKTWKEVENTPMSRKHQRQFENLKPAIIKCTFGQTSAFGLNLAEQRERCLFGCHACVLVHSVTYHLYNLGPASQV